MQVQNKKNWKTKYRTAKDNNNETGRGRTTFKYYDDLDRVLGHRPASRPLHVVVLDASAGGLSLEEDKKNSEGESGKTHNLFTYMYQKLIGFFLQKMR